MIATIFGAAEYKTAAEISRSERHRDTDESPDAEYEGLVEPVLGGETDGAACSQPAQSDHGCDCHGNSCSDLSGSGTNNGKDTAGKYKEIVANIAETRSKSDLSPIRKPPGGPTDRPT
ncbi:hypothetical protein DPMN_105768 [Dreissena polymorpha]|uniref:Uncharacterized protein n=1 Tax=Dreissena polymorpha TaxID=45954 RepID=A0A9D4K3S3_DREPO|nr:hypothetical protein DPMN_105768 [Dreissena polymorpha]